MPGFGDTTFILLLALLLFGPKKLPGLARQLGKLMAEFRRASNDFRSQIEEELRISDQADRQKQIAALEASAPSQPIPAPEHPHLDPITPLAPSPEEIAALDPIPAQSTPDFTPDETPEPTIAPPQAAHSAPAPLPIASSGELDLMPPSTGLPLPNTAFTRAATAGPEPIPSHSTNGAPAEQAAEPEAHLHG